jgi:hypothetical protein
MRRTILVLSPFTALGLLAWAWSAAPPAADPLAVTGAKLRAAPFVAVGKVAPAEALARVITYRGTDDPRTTLADVLAELGKLAEVRIDVNERAFKYEMLNQPLRVPVAEEALPRMRAPLATVLRKVLERVPIPSGATFLVRTGSIEVTSGQFLQAEVWGKDYRGAYLPLVNARLRNQPLAEALDELAEQADFSVILDGKAAAADKAKVTARFRNTPLDVAVGVLADTAGLRAVLIRNTLYVTTAERAREWAEWAAKDLPKPEDDAEPVGGGAMLGGISGRFLRLPAGGGAGGM